ncbi:MAG: hypothetical protein GX801_08825 [Fibrobacter sp.]|nr:hypothetical protein [Fibrobacter sp.]
MAKKNAIKKWQNEHRIPGKIQSIFTTETDFEGDWKIAFKRYRMHTRLELQTPASGVATPQLVQDIYDYFKRDHIRNIKKNTLQAILRSNGKNQWVFILHTNIRSAQNSRSIKVLEDFIRRNFPEIIAFHCLSTRPWHDFDLKTPPRAMRYDLRKNFGPEFFTLAGPHRHLVHALDWLPLNRYPYLQLPERLLQAINPKPDDFLLEMHCGSGFIGCSMAGHFKKVWCTDARAISKLSVEENIKVRQLKNVKYQQTPAEAKFVHELLVANPGRWTMIVNPQYGNALPGGFIRSLTDSNVERVLHISSNLPTLAAEVKRWRSSGYMLRKIVPLDLAPQTDNLEIALLFALDRQGVLAKKKKY